MLISCHKGAHWIQFIENTLHFSHKACLQVVLFELYFGKVLANVRYMYHTRFLSLMTMSHYLVSAMDLTDVLYSAVMPCSYG